MKKQYYKSRKRTNAIFYIISHRLIFCNSALLNYHSLTDEQFEFLSFRQLFGAGIENKGTAWIHQIPV